MISAQDVQHWLMGAVLLAVGLAGASGYVLISSNAQEVTVEISSIPPEVVGGTVKLCDNSTVIPNNEVAISSCSNISSLAPSAGADRELSLFFTARDDNGNGDIPLAGNHQATLFHDTNSNTGDASCSGDNNNCYQLTCSKAVDIAGGGNTDSWMRCDFALKYYADHSDGAAQWGARVYVEDASALSDDDTSYTTEVSKLVSGTFPVVNFGSRTQGTQTTAGSNLNVQHQNTGNVLLDVLVSLDDDDTNAALECDTGNYAVSNLRYDLTDVGYASAATTLTAEPTTTEMNIDIEQRTNDVAPVVDDNTGDIQRSYWNANVPASGPEGFCEEELNVTFFEGP